MALPVAMALCLDYTKPQPEIEQTKPDLSFIIRNILCRLLFHLNECWWINGVSHLWFGLNCTYITLTWNAWRAFLLLWILNEVHMKEWQNVFLVFVLAMRKSCLLTVVLYILSLLYRSLHQRSGLTDCTLTCQHMALMLLKNLVTPCKPQPSLVFTWSSTERIETDTWPLPARLWTQKCCVSCVTQPTPQ